VTLTYGSMTGIDTNVLLRAALQDDDVQSPLAERVLSGFTKDSPGFITMIALVELYWTLVRKKGLDRTHALLFIRRLVESESLEFDDGEGVVRALTFAEEGADFADALINSMMEQFGATETVTFDKGASERLGWKLLSA